MCTFDFGVVLDEFDDKVCIILIGVFLFLEVGVEEGVGLVRFLLVLGEHPPQRLLFQVGRGLEFDEDVFHQQWGIEYIISN